MPDFPLTLLFAASEVFLSVTLTAAVVDAHTDLRVPLQQFYGRNKLGRRALLVEVPILVVVVGGGGFVLLLVLVHASSTIPVRVVAGSGIALMGGWLIYLGRRLSGDG